MVAGQSYVDTEAGFLLNEDDLLDKNKPVLVYFDCTICGKQTKYEKNKTTQCNGVSIFF